MFRGCQQLDVVPRAKRELQELGMVGGVWDKDSPTRFYAISSKLRDARLLITTNNYLLRTYTLGVHSYGHLTSLLARIAFVGGVES